MSTERRRLTLSFLLSLLIHLLVLSLTFGGEEFGLPGFGFPWRERRIEAPNLHVVLLPARVTAAEPASKPVVKPPQLPSIERTVAGGPAVTPSVSFAPPRGPTARAIVPKAKPKTMARAVPKPVVAATALPDKAPLRTEGYGDTVPKPIPEPVVIAMERSDEDTWVVPAALSAPTSDIVVAPSTSSPEIVMPAPRGAGEEAQKRAEPEVQEQAVEVAKLDPPERVAQPDQLKAAQLEVQRQETARQEAVRQAAARLEAQRQETARQEAVRLEAARLEIERQESARQAAARLEAQRQETARQEAARVEAARLAAEQEEDAKREARRRAMGRQLDEEAARREAAAAATRSPPMLPLSLSTARRVRLWGRSDPNEELVKYAEAWARKIQLNTSIDTVRAVAKRPHTEPMVTVAIRSDGSVESVTFVLSSGVAEIDEAIRRIVQSHAPYQAFPPELSRQFDIIEVRRTWYFDMAVRLY
ncbi:MAG TPA: TonB C-terminal domain-containing protein [Rhodocyclaceae bacterium]|nr:TonB C-terminal domain-containing protein [Rhodocyclaceae bacterium]